MTAEEQYTASLPLKVFPVFFYHQIHFFRFLFFRGAITLYIALKAPADGGMEKGLWGYILGPPIICMGAGGPMVGKVMVE